MEEKLTKPRFRRQRKNRTSSVEALTNAQKIAFAPFTFQAVAAMLDFNILQSLNDSPKTKQEIQSACSISEYTADVLFDAALYIGLVEKDEQGKYSLTALAEAFLFDEMTRVNFNFVRDICYLGASELSESFKENRPAGLQKYLFDSETIYSKLPELNEKMKKSWYEFDHHYSDDCFRETIPLIFEAAFKNSSEKLIFDIGGNTGKFERACLEYDRDCTVTMIDLKENIEVAQKNFNTERCKFFAANILKDELPQISGAVFMSQFLDCFSKKQILKILNKVAKHSDKDTKIFILEPFIDKQQFEGAAYALSHISMYFTCMANGNSKMYNESEMKEIIEKSDLKLERVYQNIGKYDYTLLECTKR